jgi:hypothetical protein
MTIRHFPDGYPPLLSYIHAAALCLAGRSFLPSVSIPIFELSVVPFPLLLLSSLSSSVLIFYHQASPTLHTTARVALDIYQSLFRRHSLFVFSPEHIHIQDAILNTCPCRSREPGLWYVTDKEGEEGRCE